MRSFVVELAHIDSHIYETLQFRVAQHPSENADRLVVRVLARVLAHEEGLEFGRGLANVDEPALWAKDLQGNIKHWIDVGAPSAQRLHRASKQVDRVSVFTGKHAVGLRKEWRAQRIHRAEAIELVLLDPPFLAALAEGIGKQNQWAVTLSEGYLNVVHGDQAADCQLEQTTIAEFL